MSSIVNKKCSCGSGKKYKNCCARKKSRTYKMTLDPSIISDYEGIAIDKFTGHVKGIKNGKITTLLGNSSFNIHYKRDSGKPKNLQQFTIEAEELQLNPNFVLTKYDHLFFVDTNKKEIGNDEICLGTVVHAYVNKLDDDTIQFNYRLMTYLEYHNVKGKFENLVWCEVIKAIQDASTFTGRIALVVDSDLGNLEEFNTQNKPIYEEFYLPGNFTLIYATAEKNTKNDSLLNGVMYECDRAASQMLAEARIQNPLSLNYFTDKPYTAFRQWIE